MPYLYISLILRKLQTQRYACNRDPVDKHCALAKMVQKKNVRNDSHKKQNVKKSVEIGLFAIASRYRNEQLSMLARSLLGLFLANIVRTDGL